MKKSLIVSTQFIRRVALVCICTLAAHGCSSSSDSSSNNIQASGQSSEDTANGANATSDEASNGGANIDSENPDSGIPLDGTSSEMLTEDLQSAPGDSSITPVNGAQSPGGSPDASSQTTTRVTFDITVPAYMSNELQVRLESGDVNTTAAFVRDESWSVSGTFPTNTDNLLVVTFADSNGAITLGTAETSFITSPATSQTVPITADQFNTERWDSDNDGVSNLDELIAGTFSEDGDLPQAIQASLEILPIKTFRIDWQPSANAEFYRVLENPDGISGFSPISEDLTTTTLSFDHQVALFNRVNAGYIVQACNANGCIDSDPLLVTGNLASSTGYFKASNTDIDDEFGTVVSLSADGQTLAVGAPFEDSAATGINGDQEDNSAMSTGAVYVFLQNAGQWQQQAYIKASNARPFAFFGLAMSLSADGNTLAVGARNDNSATTGINGDQNDNSAPGSGAAYVFVRSGEVWQQQAYIKASNTDEEDRFGNSVSLSANGNTLAVGAPFEDSDATGIDGDQTNNSAATTGAVYVFARRTDQWQQQAYIKASNPDIDDDFGGTVYLSGDGNTLAVAAGDESSSATGINGDQSNNSASRSGAVYVFVLANESWQQEAYIKASNTGESDRFGGFDRFAMSISLSQNGNTLAIGAPLEDSAATGINGDQSDDSLQNPGAVYVFTRNGGVWQQQAYVKSSNSGRNDFFGSSVSLSADGKTMAVGAENERSDAMGINGDQGDNALGNSGAVYVFARSGGLWQQQAYVKASDNLGGSSDEFGSAVSLGADGNTLAVGATDEESAATGINGDQNDNSAFAAGAVYVY